MPNAGKDVEPCTLSFIAGGNAEWTQPLWETVWSFLTKLIILILHNPPIVLLGNYPKELKTYVHPKICTRMVALFIIAKT